MTPTIVQHRRIASPPESALGLTLIEVMVGILLFAILATGAFAAFSVQQSTSTFQQKSEGTVDSARSLLNVMAMQARAAKGGMPNGNVRLNTSGAAPAVSAAALTSANCLGAPDFQLPIIQVVDGGATGADTLRILAPDGVTWGQVVNPLTNLLSNGGTQIILRTRDPGPAFQPALALGDWVLVTNFTPPVRVPPITAEAALFQMSAAVQDGAACTGGQAGDFCLTKVAGTGLLASPLPVMSGFLIKARWWEYSVVNNQLMVTDLLSGVSEPAADSVDDLQVALGYDRNSPGTAGFGEISPDSPPGSPADEWIWNNGGDSFPEPSICTLANLRAIRISLVVRATAETPEARSTPPVLENHTTVGAQDNFYRLTLRSVIALR